MSVEASMSTHVMGRRPLVPLVSIVIAVHNDEEYVAKALDSAISQSLPAIEIICVDDLSTDGTCGVVEEYLTDPRVHLIRHDKNGSAFQARRTGIEAATAPYVLFLDGDDELAPRAAELAVARAKETGADIVGFGVEVVMPPGEGAPRFEGTLQPRHAELNESEIVSGLFPIGEPAQGHLWRYLFGVELLREAYNNFDRDVAFYRANDIPIAFLAIAAAAKYVSTRDKLYRYFFRRGTSGHRISILDHFLFYLGAIDSIDSIDAAVERLSLSADKGDAVQHSYDSARRSVIANVLQYCEGISAENLRNECLNLLASRVGELDLVLAAADFRRGALEILVRRSKQLHEHVEPPARATSVVLTTSNLGTGGLQGVLVAQAHHLVRAGIDVTVVVHRDGPVEHEMPFGVSVVRAQGRTWASKIEEFLSICANAGAETVIDHHLLYNEYWPFYALAARAVGISTIGWLHNFALRPMFDGTTRASFLIANLPVLHTVVALSRTDVAFWKLNGVENVVFLPNPLPPLLVELEASTEPKHRSNSRVELVWWGRLQQATKQVRELIKVAKALRECGTEFRLTIIGPDGPDLSRKQLMAAAREAGVRDSVSLPGPLQGDALISALSAADICLMTSAIEGYPLTLVEAQAVGLPVVMYELPWVAFLEGNGGVLTVPQDDHRGMAEKIAWLASDEEGYSLASAGALAALRRLREIDFASLYRQLIEGELTEDHSPEARPEDFALLSRLSVLYSERTARAVRRAQTRVARMESQISRDSRSIAPNGARSHVPAIDQFSKYRARSKPRWRQAITRVIPSTWRQANHLAEKQAKWSSSALSEIAAEQARLSDSVRRVEQLIRDSRVSRNRRRE